MSISHADALHLERVVRNYYHCDRASMGGFIDADHYESNPFDAALIALSPIWEKTRSEQIGDFLNKWSFIVDDEETRFDVSTYIDELSSLVNRLRNSADYT